MTVASETRPGSRSPLSIRPRSVPGGGVPDVTKPVASAFTPYFPHADTSTEPLEHKPLPSRPSAVGPVFDSDLSSVPIHTFDQHFHETAYSPRPDGVDADLPPSEQAVGHSDPYLMPSLTKNERLRLTMLWYYAADVLKDEEFLRRLQERLDLVRDFFKDYEFAIIGLLSEDVYTRLVTVGLPLAILPRRESTCSHTVNQKPGTTFMLPNMGNDWRFKQSPHVEFGGLRSYAGAQLRCKLPDGQQVALGSLCIASNTPQPPLNPVQQASLVRFADIFASEIVSHSRESRRRQRHRLGQLLSECRPDSDALSLFEARVKDIVQNEYQKSSVEFRVAVDGVIHAPGLTDIPVRDVCEGLWEDTEHIEDLIVRSNQARLETSRTVRAIVCACQTYPVPRYLVVSTSNVQAVFDDVDAWFIEKCAAMYCTFVQDARLREALQAKDIFLRGITHQLRTPIHGILGSVDLLAEELASRNLLLEDPTVVRGCTHPSAALKTIRESGRELMSTVNNILKLNRWAETIEPAQPAHLRVLDQLEEEIMYEVGQVIPERESDVIVFFENQLASRDGTITLNLPLIKECIQALVMNALAFTQHGSVVVVISSAPDHSKLSFDIIDTGCGIPQADRDRIFEAYEKVLPHTRGAGLGLTLASKIARAVNGSVTLLSSSQNLEGHGSHFRAEFSVQLACAASPLRTGGPLLHNVSKSFRILPNGRPWRHQALQHFANYLENRGFKESDDAESSLVIIPYDSETSKIQEMTKGIGTKQVAICLFPTGATVGASLGNNPNVRFFTGPFLSSRLDEMLREMDELCKGINATATTVADDVVSQDLTSMQDRGSKERIITIETTELLTDGEATAAEPVALLVDDNEVNLRILRMYCEKRAIPYTTAVNGAEAIERFQEAQTNRSFTLVLMDLQMPVCDGVEATAQIRALDQKATILMVTGQDSALDRTRSLEAGADGFYVKPMSIRTLDAAVGEYFPAFRKKMEALKSQSKRK